MQKDANNIINFATEVSDDVDADKESLIAQGNELIKEEIVTYNGLELIMQAFNVNGCQMLSYNYIFIGDTAISQSLL